MEYEVDLCVCVCVPMSADNALSSPLDIPANYSRIGEKPIDSMCTRHGLETEQYSSLREVTSF